MNFLRAFAQLDTSPLPGNNLSTDTFGKGLREFYIITGAVALLVVTIAGFRIVLARGNPQNVAQAREMILYALIGLVIIVAAGTIVGFVINSGI